MQYNKLIKQSLLLALFSILSLSPSSLFATTYTAVVSGNWSSSLTWAGSVPPATITGEDNIIINAGITVNMNTDVQLNNSLASIAIAGNLESSTNVLIVTSGSVTGTGGLIVDELIVGASGTVATTGTIVCDAMETASSSLVISASTSIASELRLTSGLCQLSSGGSIMFDANATIHVSGGSLAVLSGTLGANGSINLLYTGSSNSTSDETTAGTVANLTVDLSSNNETLTMDGDVMVTSTLSLMAGVFSTNGHDLTLEGNSEVQAGATISGDANSNLSFNGNGDMGTINFTSGAESFNDVTISIGETSGSSSITLGSDLEVEGTLNLESGELELNGNDLTLTGTVNSQGSASISGDSNSNLFCDGEGDMGTIQFTTGAENFNDVTISIGETSGSSSIALGADLEVEGTLNLESGELELNGNDLTLTGNVNSQGSASISGDSNSNLFCDGEGDMGTIQFTAEAESLNDVTISIGEVSGSSSITLGSDLEVEGTLQLQEGHLELSDNNLEIMTNGSITGQSEGSYVMTSGEGSLLIGLTAGGMSMEYPVGTEEGYFPTIIGQAEGASNTVIEVRAMAGVLASGDFGSDLTTTQNLVNHTWFVGQADANANVDLSFEFFWSSDAEVNAFNSSTCFISHYVNGSWDAHVAAAATVEANGYLSISRQGITSLSPFRVADDSVLPAIEFTEKDFSFYPNPSKDYIFLELPEDLKGSIAEIFSVDGRLIQSHQVNNSSANQLSISNLPSGVYFLKLENSGAIKFVKE